MAFSDAEHLVRLFGAGSVLCVGGADPLLAQQLRQKGALVDCIASLDDLPGAGARYDVLVVEAIVLLEPDATLVGGLQALRALGARWIAIRFIEHRALIRSSLDAGPRRAWDEAALKAGWRRAPQAISIDRYFNDCQDPQVPLLLEYELLPTAGAAHAEDWSRQPGGAADAAMVRYALAATLVRHGDTVLDAQAGAGAGSALLAAQSAAARVIGAVADPAYAAAQFSAQYDTEYHGPDLAQVEDDSIDLLVAFDLPQSPEAFLNQALRVLKPDGRIVVGGAPGCVEQVARLFLLEERWTQSVPPAARTLLKLAPDAGMGAADCVIAVASVDPLTKQTTRAYVDPEFAQQIAPPGCWVAEFGRHYDNPWLYRTMVHMGDRLRDRGQLADLAARALGQMPMDSADFGAALTVLAYALLDTPDTDNSADALNLIEAYLGQDLDNPHAQRWQMSAAFVGARLALGRRERDLARAWFAAVAAADFMVFSPLLATKSIAAAFQLGAMALAEGRPEDASAHFADGVALCRRAMHADDLNAIGNPDAPYPFGFTELAEVADMGAQCATALKLLPQHAKNPGLFWRQVDTKRFGVVSWALALERDNQALRAQLAR